jgi:Icc-related predicted phosphoesterase
VYATDPLNPAFGSNLDRTINASGAVLWVHGHIHYATDYVIGRTRVVNNPRGYPNEPLTGFDPGLVIEV